MNKKIFVPILIAVGFSLIAILLIISSMHGRRFATPTIAVPATPSIGDTANHKFINEVGPVDLLNIGLIAERTPMINMQGATSVSPNYISILVLNQTNEPIVFNDVGFDLQVFGYQPDNPEWTKIKLPTFPEKTPTILPPKLETYNFALNNMWDISDNDLKDVTFKYIRIYISGAGQISQKIYGAFLDVTLQK